MALEPLVGFLTISVVSSLIYELYRYKSNFSKAAAHSCGGFFSPTNKIKKYQIKFNKTLLFFIKI